MKIRIKGNSLRIRISKTEVENLCKNSRIEEKTDFGNNTFSYILQSSAENENLDAGFLNGVVTMHVPDALLKGWESNETVGFSHNKPLPGGEHLFLLLEKDFKCIDNTMMEDQSDNFDNPLHTCS